MSNGKEEDELDGWRRWQKEEGKKRSEEKENEASRLLFWVHPGTRPIVNWIEMRRGKSRRSKMYGWTGDTYLNWLDYAILFDKRWSRISKNFKNDNQMLDKKEKI